MNTIWYPHIPYDMSYPKLFEKEKERIKKTLKIDQIYHFGSTAVPNLGGKGYIDIYLVVNKNDLDKTLKIIQEKLEYEYSEKASIPNERLFFKRIDTSNRRYHLHLTYKGNKDIDRVLVFKKYLLENQKYAKEYEEIKKQASVEANKQKTKKGAYEVYMGIKKIMIEKIVDKV